MRRLLMCTATIIDASLFGWYANASPMQSAVALRSWINRKHGVVAYVREGRFDKELRECRKMYSLFEEYRRNGQAFHVPREKIRQAEEQIGGRKIKSDDRHVLLLALASEAQVLCTDDKDLGADFKNEHLLPKVGRKKRAIYPYESDPKSIREFLGARKCR